MTDPRFKKIPVSMDCKSIEIIQRLAELAHDGNFSAACRQIVREWDSIQRTNVILRVPIAGKVDSQGVVSFIDISASNAN